MDGARPLRPMVMGLAWMLGWSLLWLPSVFAAPLGSHGAPKTTLTGLGRKQWPSTATFWHEYVDGYRPGVFSELATLSPAFRSWNAEYLTQMYGSMNIVYESGQENRAGSWQKSGPVPLGVFLEDEQTPNYVVSSVPHAMLDDVYFPAFMQCGKRTPTTASGEPGQRWMTPVQETGLWMSYQPTRSSLHYDHAGILNCLFAGPPKTWILYDSRKYANRLYSVKGAFRQDDHLSTMESDWSRIDPADVDLNEFPELLDIPFEEAQQHAGDCIWVPFGYFHQVTKADANFSVAVSFMLSGLTTYDRDSCISPPPFAIPASHLDTVWYYEGRGVNPVGYGHPIEECNILWEFLQERENQARHLVGGNHQLSLTWQMLMELHSGGVAQEIAVTELKRWFDKHAAQHNGASIPFERLRMMSFEDCQVYTVALLYNEMTSGLEYITKPLDVVRQEQNRLATLLGTVDLGDQADIPIRPASAARRRKKESPNARPAKIEEVYDDEL